MTAKGTVLVTGASGFIAKHIVRQLLEAGYRVRGSVRAMTRGEELKTAMAATLSDANRLDQRLEIVTLDLDKDDGWQSALEGVDTLMHTASPFPLEQPSDPQAVIRPAVNGTLRALRAAKMSGVERVVLTSSSVALMYSALPPGRTAHDERDWSDLSASTATPYVKSKTLAERAAWDFVAGEGSGMKLTAINPALVVGPPLDATLNTSLRVIQRLLRAKDPMLPNFGFPTVDVRDVARMHVRALERPASIGERFVAGDQFLWFPEMARILKDAFPDRPIVTRRAPNVLMRFLALFDNEIRTIIPNLDQETRISSDKARHSLGIDFIDARESLVASARELIVHHLV